MKAARGPREQEVFVNKSHHRSKGPKCFVGAVGGLLSGLSDEVRLGEYAKMCRTIKLQILLPDLKSLGVLSTYRV